MNPLTNYGRILHRFWWLVVLTTLITTGSTLVVTARQTPVYRSATMQFVVPNSRVQANGEILRSLDTLDRRSVLATIARVPLTKETRDEAAARMGLRPDELRTYRIGSFVLPNTNLIKVEVEGPNAERSAQLVNTVAVVMQDVGRDMYRIYKIDTLEGAVPASRPIRPTPGRNLLAGAVLGLFIGMFAAAVAEYVRSHAPHGVRPAPIIEESHASGN